MCVFVCLCEYHRPVGGLGEQREKDTGILLVGRISSSSSG